MWEDDARHEPAATSAGDIYPTGLPPRFNLRVRFYGLVDLSVLEAIELYATREQAECALAEVLADEPEWQSILRVEEVSLSCASSLN